MSLTRRSLLGTSAVAGISLFDPYIVLGADKTLTIALPNNPTTLDPIQISNHDSMAVSNVVFENLLEVDLDGNVGPSLAHKMPEISTTRQSSSSICATTSCFMTDPGSAPRT
jgi:peptide/nickel transport system substrate-binding protein